jgi:uncharacterized protein
LSARLANIRLHPIKSLDPVAVSAARIGPNGGLELDRAWALHSADGRWVNAKRAPAMLLIRAEYPADLGAVTLAVPGDRRNIVAGTFAFPGDTAGASAWFSAYFEQPITVRYAREGFPDDGLAPGPTIVSTASLRAVREWFPELTLDEVRRRFRATLEIDGVAESEAVSNNGNHLPAFWEDRLFAGSEADVARFKIGEVAFEGSNPCARCPVPSRDSHSAEILTGFQMRFVELRRKHLPAWSPGERFDHFYRLATNTRVPGTEEGKLLRVGDVLNVG